MANKRRPLRIPAFLCVLATTVYTLGNLCSGPPVQAQAQTGWQDVAGGNFLADSTVSGDVGKIIADTATGTFTSGKESGTVYLDLYQEDSDSRAQIAPAEGALLAYDIEVVRGGIYLNPGNLLRLERGNAFIQAINNAHNTDGGESSLGQGQYTGAVDLSEVARGQGSQQRDAETGTKFAGYYTEAEIYRTQNRTGGCSRRQFAIQV